MIPHSRPSIDNKEAVAATRVLASGYLAQGKEVAGLEKELCAVTGHRSGLATSSGSAALFGALKCLGVGRGDRVVIPSFACTALANAVFLTNAQPVICDVEASNGLMSSATVKQVLNSKVKAIIVPHHFGVPAPVHAIEKECGIPVVEDCAQCIGATIDGKTAGSLGTIAIFSFYATKVLAAGEGGCITTSDRRFAKRLEDMREYDNRQQFEPRFNFKMSDLTAAVAREQLKKLPRFLRRRRSIAKKYSRALSGKSMAGPFPEVLQQSNPMFFRYIIRTEKRSAVQRHFHRHQVACARPIFKPFHMFSNKRGFPVSARLYEELLSIPLYPALTDDEVGIVVEALKGLK